MVSTGLFQEEFSATIYHRDYSNSLELGGNLEQEEHCEDWTASLNQYFYLMFIIQFHSEYFYSSNLFCIHIDCGL